MQLSKQLFCHEMYVPKNWQSYPTSKLLEDGCFCHFRDPSIPFYMPLGQLVLDGIRNVVNRYAQICGFNHISLPTIARDTLLKQGSEIEEAFLEKMMSLGGAMEGYHLLFTPEPIIHDLAGAKLLSYRQLPIRYCYHVDMFRNVTDARGLLKTRQFQTFVATTIEHSQESVAESIKLFESLALRTFDELGVSVRVCRDRKGIAFELFYDANEGEKLFIPEINPDSRTHALSLAMGYQYCPEKKLSTRFLNSKNVKQAILMTTHAIGVQRLFYVIFDAHRDKLGFKLPKQIRPADIVVIPKSEVDIGLTMQLDRDLTEDGRRIVVDDRCQIPSGRRAAFSDYIGSAWKLRVDGEAYSLTNRDLTKSVQGNRSDVLSALNSAD